MCVMQSKNKLYKFSNRGVHARCTGAGSAFAYTGDVELAYLSFNGCTNTHIVRTVHKVEKKIFIQSSILN